jgi:hypothetical protein
VRRDRDRLLEALIAFRAEVRMLRSEAAARCAELYRQRDLEHARSAEPDPTTRVH